MINFEDLLSEVSYKAVRSSGAGGQNVNKVATKVVLQFNIEESQILSEEHKERLREFFKTRLDKNGILTLNSSESRSQFRNKTLVTQRFLELLEEGLKEEKERIPTKTPRAVKQKRLKNKKIQSDKKANRKKPDV
ncbi:alternative ribosome rescue aminoacyl-tRNA hydrolase ArfB [Winogradskyella maritima]|uniref:Alternative ribosome rescue aminoacyl-tRNA hydrolase ArfB n=1 Tax=Winogradskyella maritima TaxID=1517766 RepID=A0ABV8AGI0_9FLAO|nr:alternative ribosome rescue aminoacyl-tRNA hydrolase ArfB [Winogradskyella maritima]